MPTRLIGPLATLSLIMTFTCCVAQTNSWQPTQPQSQTPKNRIPTPTPLTAPTAPSDLAATASGLTTVNLTWLNTSPQQDGQIIQRCTGAACSNFVTLIEFSPKQQNWVDDTAISGSTYSYRVAAFHNQTYSAWSASASLTMPTTPTAPSTLSAVASGGFQIDLAWSDNSSNEEGFVIERCSGLSCADFSQINITSSDAESYSDTGLSVNTVYCYQVKASSDYGDSTYTNEAGDQTSDVTPTPTPTASPTPGPGCATNETIVGAAAAWCLNETDTAVVDEVGSISLAAVGSPTFEVAATSPFDIYSPGVTIASGQGFYVDGVKSAMNIGTGSTTITWVATKNAVSANYDTVFTQDDAWAKGAACYWYNASWERLRCVFYNTSIDYVGCTWNTGTTNSIPGDNTYHVYKLILDRTVPSINLKIDDVTQGSGCSASGLAGDSLTNTGFWLGTSDSLGTATYLGNILWIRQALAVE